MSETPEAQPAPETPDATPSAPTEVAPTPPAAPGAVAVAEPPAEPPAQPPAQPPADPSADRPAPGPAPAAAPAAAAPPARKAGSVQVPVWVLIVVTVLVVGVGAFFVGRETAPDSGDSGPKTLAEAVQDTASGDMEVGDFDLRSLLQALRQNEDLDLGALGDLILGQGGRN